jgi:NADH-quinone oxidoreductase subunit I
MPIAKPKIPVCEGHGVTLKTLDHTMDHGRGTVQYPHEKEAPPRAPAGVIACRRTTARSACCAPASCPDWCIYIEGHKESGAAPPGGGKPRR